MLVANILWGLSTPVNKLGLESIEPGMFLTIRYTMAALILLPFSYKIWRRYSKKVLAELGVAALISPGVAVSMGFVALTMVPSINVSIVSAFIPIITMLCAVILIKEPFRKGNLAGLIIGATGIIVIVLEPVIGHDGGASLLVGNLLLVGSVLLAGAGTVIKKPLLKQVSPLDMSLVVFMVSALVNWIFAAMTGQLNTDGILAIAPSGWFSLFYAIFISGLLAFWLFYYALGKLLAEDAAVYTYVDPIVGVIGAALILGESASPILLIGAGLVALGIYISEVRRTFHLHHLFHKAHK